MEKQCDGGGEGAYSERDIELTAVGKRGDEVGGEKHRYGDKRGESFSYPCHGVAQGGGNGEQKNEDAAKDHDGGEKPVDEAACPKSDVLRQSRQPLRQGYGYREKREAAEEEECEMCEPCGSCRHEPLGEIQHGHRDGRDKACRCYKKLCHAQSPVPER